MKRLQPLSTWTLILALAFAAIPTGAAFADSLGPLTSAVAVSPDPVTGRPTSRGFDRSPINALTPA